MNKKELRQSIIDQQEKLIHNVNDLPNALFDILNVFECMGQIKLSNKADFKTLDELYDMLHNLKPIIGNYKLNYYWTPYESCLCISYHFDNLNQYKYDIYFSIAHDNLQEVLNTISNGKCKIVARKRQKIVCNLN